MADPFDPNARPCCGCGTFLAECMGFTIGRDQAEALAGRLSPWDVREICARCSEIAVLTKTPEQVSEWIGALPRRTDPDFPFPLRMAVNA